jgi:Flp pilus assembly protein TadD
MSKPMMVTLPFVFLLLDYWPLGRWPNEISAPVNIRGHLIGRLLWEKTPFIFLTIISSIVTLWTQNKGDLFTPIMRMSFTERIANAIIAYVSYLGKIFWPVNLAVFYPYEHSFALWQILCSCFILIGITIVVICVMRKLPFLFVGWFWYLGTLIPMIGVVQAGGQAMADRYTYLPSIGVAIMLSWGIPLLFPSAEMRKKILVPAAITCLAILAVLTWQQCGYWKNSTTLFNHALQVTKNNYLAQNNLASALFEEGKIEEAVDHYNKAINITSNPADVYNNRGTAYVKRGRYQRAIEDFNTAIRLKPDNADTYYNRGMAYAALGRYQLAIEDYNKAILITPDDGDYNDSETVYIKFGQYQRAIGNAYAGLAQYQRAIDDYNLAVRLTPEDADAHYNRGIAHYKLGQYQRAIEDFNEAIRLKPDDVLAYNNRGFAYFMQGNKELGCRDMQNTCKLGNCTTLKALKNRGYCR